MYKIIIFFQGVTVGFWCQTIHKKFLRRFDTIFGLKMMMKSGLEKIILKFHDGLQSCCCPVQKNLPRKAELAWQVSRYLWRPPWNFKIIFSRPLFIIILSQKWCQISVRIFCVLPGTKNLQWWVWNFVCFDIKFNYVSKSCAEYVSTTNFSSLQTF